MCSREGKGNKSRLFQKGKESGKLLDVDKADNLKCFTP
jgi:hypothetical protein